MVRQRETGVGAGTELAFLRAYDAGRFPHPSVSVDLVLLTVEQRRLKVLLIRRGEHPHLGKWSLPGGFVGYDEPVEDAAHRVLAGKARLSGPVFMEQLYTFGEPGRDPRTRVISVAHLALVSSERLRKALTATDESISLAELRRPRTAAHGGAMEVLVDGGSVPLAFDHKHILSMAVMRIRGKLNYAPVGHQLLPREFTLRALQDVHETILGHSLNKDAFRRRLLAGGELKATGRLETEVGHRPAELYRFVPLPP